MEQLPESAREAGKVELGEPSEPRFRQKKDKGKAPIREEEGGGGWIVFSKTFLSYVQENCSQDQSLIEFKSDLSSES